MTKEHRKAVREIKALIRKCEKENLHMKITFEIQERWFPTTNIIDKSKGEKDGNSSV